MMTLLSMSAMLIVEHWCLVYCIVSPVSLSVTTLTICTCMYMYTILDDIYCICTMLMTCYATGNTYTGPLVLYQIRKHYYYCVSSTDVQISQYTIFISLRYVDCNRRNALHQRFNKLT